eukprot:1937656-Amphidinium_carterae.1
MTTFHLVHLFVDPCCPQFCSIACWLPQGIVRVLDLTRVAIVAQRSFKLTYQYSDDLIYIGSCTDVNMATVARSGSRKCEEEP